MIFCACTAYQAVMARSCQWTSWSAIPASVILAVCVPTKCKPCLVWEKCRFLYVLSSVKLVQNGLLFFILFFYVALLKLRFFSQNFWWHFLWLMLCSSVAKEHILMNTVYFTCTLKNCWTAQTSPPPLPCMLLLGPTGSLREGWTVHE